MKFRSDKEEWRTVHGYPDYEVSNLGRVRSKARVVAYTSCYGKECTRQYKSRMLRPAQPDWYPFVALTGPDGMRDIMRVHRLVARAFIGKPPKDKPWVLHRNDDPSDPRASNLKYGSVQDNHDDCVSKDRQSRGSRNGLAVLDEETVLVIRRKLAKGSHGIGRILARQYGVSDTIISDIKHRRIWRHI